MTTKAHMHTHKYETHPSNAHFDKHPTCTTYIQHPIGISIWPNPVRPSEISLKTSTTPPAKNTGTRERIGIFWEFSTFRFFSSQPFTYPSPLPSQVPFSSESDWCKSMWLCSAKNRLHNAGYQGGQEGVSQAPTDLQREGYFFFAWQKYSGEPH